MLDDPLTWDDVFERYRKPPAGPPWRGMYPNPEDLPRLLKQRRADPERNPLLPPRPGELDPLPPCLREGIGEIRRSYAPMDQDTMLWYARNWYMNMGAAVGRGEPLSDPDRRRLADALAAIGRGEGPVQALFGRPRRGRPPDSTSTQVQRLVGLVWHDRKAKLKPEYVAAGYRLVTEGRPPWIASNQATAFRWVAEFLNINLDDARKRFFEKTERYPTAAPSSLRQRELEDKD